MGEQFRALDSIGRLSIARFAVLFAGTPEQARGRQANIARGISGIYAGPDGRIKVKADLTRAFEIEDVRQPRWKSLVQIQGHAGNCVPQCAPKS